MLTNRSILNLIQSNGGSYAGSDFASQYVKQMMAFVGVKEHQQINIEGIDHHPEKATEILGAALTSATQAAATF